MLDLLYTEALNKKSSINYIVDEIFNKKVDIESKWNNAKITPSDTDLTLAAGDGSYNKKKFIKFIFYAVGAETIIYTPKDSDSRIKTVESVEVDIMSHQLFLEERLRNMMATSEIKTANQSFDEYDIDYYMLDGSILGDLIRPLPTEKDIPVHYKMDIIRKIKEEEFNFSPLTIKEEYKELIDNEKIDENSLLNFLESLQHLVELKKLLNNKEKIIAVSKTSTSYDLFHSKNVPDIAILDMFTKNEGYSQPYYKKVTNEIKHDFPIEDEFFKSLWFTVFFVRLESHKNIIKIELPYYANEDEIKNILSILKSNATDGYPFLLKKAHNDVVIKNNDITSLSQIIEFIDKSGREMLD